MSDHPSDPGLRVNLHRTSTVPTSTSGHDSHGGTSPLTEVCEHIGWPDHRESSICSGLAPHPCICGVEGLPQRSTAASERTQACPRWQCSAFDGDCANKYCA